jgi:tetraacyldisaccharide 4'-kinase
VNPLLLPFSAGFRVGVALRLGAYRHGWLKTRRLSRAVISVGNLTVGGTGKTPLVARVADILLKRGLKPSILTRGYGRLSPAEMVVIAPGPDRRPVPEEVGNEPALLARWLPEVPLVVCADRFRAGQVAEERFQVDAHLLDDGFQHWALARDVDVVALDATRTISDWNLLPAGRQREPLTAVRRAQIIVLTRTDSADPAALEHLVAKVHPAAKVFHSRTKLVRWINVVSGEPVPNEVVGARKAAAFCAIGNPRAFFTDLHRWGCTLVAEDAFRDHHVYTGKDLRRLCEAAHRQRAAALLTTQKDAVKISQDWELPLPVLACEIAAEILGIEDFRATLLRYIEKAS